MGLLLALNVVPIVPLIIIMFNSLIVLIGTSIYVTIVVGSI